MWKLLFLAILANSLILTIGNQRFDRPASEGRPMKPVSSEESNSLEDSSEEECDSIESGEEEGNGGSSDPSDEGSSDPSDEGSSDPSDEGSSDPSDEGSSDPSDEGEDDACACSGSGSGTGSGSDSGSGSGSGSSSGSGSGTESQSGSGSGTGSGSGSGTGSGSGSGTGSETGCRGDESAEPGCDEDCSQRCPIGVNTECSCPAENSCKCKDGFFFDTTTFECVEECPIDCVGAPAKFAEATLRLSGPYVKSFAASIPGETGSASPLATLFLIGGLALASENETRAETTELLGMTLEEIKCAFNFVNNAVTELPDDVEYSGATNFYGNIQYPFTDNFKYIMEEIVVGVAESYDFSNSDEVADTINAEIAERTNNKIPNIIQDSSIFNQSTELVAVSALYFKSPWEIEFEKSEEFTEFRAHCGKIIPTEFFYQEAIYNYTHSSQLGAKVLQVHYKERKYTSYFILPDEPFKENEVIKKMQADPTGWFAKVLEDFREEKVRVNIPVYNKLTYNIDSRALLVQSTDLETVYSGETIQLKDAIENDIPAGVTAGAQAINLETTYDGGPVPELPSGGATLSFDADYPFVSLVFAFEYFVDLVVIYRG